jgi:hypothetical protein
MRSITKRLIARAALALLLIAGTAAALTVHPQPALADCTGTQC